MKIPIARLPEVGSSGLCIGCGFCTLNLREGLERSPPVRVSYNAHTDSFTPVLTLDTPQDEEVLCPGANMDMPALSKARYGRQPDDPITGVVVAIRACHSAEHAVRSAAASGGVVPALLTQLFDRGEIDAAYVVHPGLHVQDAHGRIITDAADLRECHGSVYHPVDFGRGLRQLAEGQQRFAFVGLPCEIAALEALKEHRPDIARRHVMSIGLFCGGVNAFGGVAYYLRRFGIELGSRAQVRYRVGNWPGRIEVRHADGTTRQVPRIQGNSRWGILRYVVAFQGYWMLPRCRMCPDQISDFADVAVGDPHLPRFRKERSAGHSIVITRTPRGERSVRLALEAKVLNEGPLSTGELLASQGYTLDNRRHVEAYLRVATRLRMRTPDLKVYASLAGSARARHYVYAWVDLLKVRLRPAKWLRAIYVPLQAFEYAFITFTPTLIIRRIARLLRNR